jgi:putative membrane protein
MLATAVALAQGGSAQPPSKSPAAPSQKAAGMSDVVPADRTFALEAAKGGLAEVELGKVAVEKASSPDVKQFGQRMIDDHGKASEELKTWASGKNLSLPTELDAKSQATKDRLSKLSGPAFDRAYISDMVRDHNKDVADFQRAEKTCKDADLKAWVQKTLPTLQEHQKMARDISMKVVGTSGKGEPKTPKSH